MLCNEEAELSRWEARTVGSLLLGTHVLSSRPCLPQREQRAAVYRQLQKFQNTLLHTHLTLGKSTEKQTTHDRC